MCSRLQVMQAAGRLRQLVNGTQTVQFVSTADVTADILQVNSLSASQAAQINALHMFTWVLHNTAQASLDGILEWVKQVCGLYPAWPPSAKP